jgi:type III secretion protein C
MAHINNLIWYFDGNTLYLYNSQEIEKEIISLLHISVEEFQQALIDIGIWDNRYYWRANPSDGLIRVLLFVRFASMLGGHCHSCLSRCRLELSSEECWRCQE